MDKHLKPSRFDVHPHSPILPQLPKNGIIGSELCADVLLGHDLMKLHSRVDVSFGDNCDKLAYRFAMPLPIRFNLINYLEV